MRKIIVGVMGPGDDATDSDKTFAHELGRMIAENDWVLLSGGRNVGVMDAVSKGAKSVDGLTIGVLPGADDDNASEAVDLAIITHMGDARNNINIHSAHAVIVCGMNPGTASEVALGMKIGKQMILVNNSEESVNFFKTLGEELVHVADSPERAIELVKKVLG